VPRACVVVILICAALYLVGNGRVSLWDRDEPRYAQASRQMLDSGDRVVPMLLDEPRINKPPLIYWCQAASMAAFRTVAPDARLSIDQRMRRDAAAARFPSSVAMALTLLLVAAAMTRFVGADGAFWTVLIFGTSGLVIMAAKMCLTDAVLLMFVTVAQLCIYTMWRDRRARWPVVIAFAVATGLGLLTKGPVVLGVNGMTLLVLAAFTLIDSRKGHPIAAASAISRDMPPHAVLDYASSGERPPFRWVTVALKILVAIVIIATIFGPWVVAMQHRLPGGLVVTLNKDVWKRMTQPLEQHKGPPGYYLLFSLASFFPWVLLMPTAIKLAWRHRTEPLIRFSLAAVIGPWIMFECIQTKLPHYVLPCFPFLAILVADCVARGVRGEHDEWAKRGWRIAVAVFALIVVALGVGPWAAAAPRLNFDRLPYAAMTIVTVAAVACAARVHVLFAKGRIDRACRALGVTMIVLMAILFTSYLPDARFLHLSEEVGGYLQSIGATTKGDVYMIDYKEDSLPFYQGGTIRPQRKNDYLATEPPAKWPTYFVITREIWNATPDAPKAHLDVLRTFHGLAYAAKGRVVDVMVVKRK